MVIKKPPKRMKPNYIYMKLSIDEALEYFNWRCRKDAKEFKEKLVADALSFTRGVRVEAK